MPTVRVHDGLFEKAFRKFKKAVDNAKIMEELRSREGYEKPSLERKRKAGAAKARHRKKISKENAEFTRSRGPK